MNIRHINVSETLLNSLFQRASQLSSYSQTDRLLLLSDRPKTYFEVLKDLFETKN